MVKKVSISQLPKYKHRQKRMDELMKNRKAIENAVDEFIEHMEKEK